jgi:hypothetical protein
MGSAMAGGTRDRSYLAFTLNLPLRISQTFKSMPSARSFMGCLLALHSTHFDTFCGGPSH